MRLTPRLLSALPSLATLLACTASPPAEPTAAFEVSVAPLTLPGVVDACYTLTVRNDVGQNVSSRSDICASRFGANGGITYISACDATDNNLDGFANNTVNLTIDGLYAAPGKASPISDYINPCAAPHAPSGCQIAANCLENTDTAVSFNLTLMRQANQGFFDIGVSFADIFCSAKLDCTNGSGAPLTLLHDPDTGLRGQTAVVALACTTGPGGAATHLLRDPLKVTCDGTTTTIDPALGKGSAYGSGPGQVADPDPTDPIWQYAVYAGSESLSCGGESCDKQYWNIAIGFDPTARDCVLTATASAVDATSPITYTTPAHSNYPLITWNVPLTTDASPAALACSKHPLNGSPTGVVTTYTGLAAAKSFLTQFDGTTFHRAPCPEGWTGALCDSPICDPACLNGGVCVEPDVCDCADGFSGPVCATPSAPPVVTSGLVLHLDATRADSFGGSGTLWNDLTANNLDGTLVNGVAFTKLDGGTMVFDGQNDSVQVANNARLKTTAITIELILVWDELSATGSNDILQFGVGSGASNGQYYFRQEGANYAWRWFPAGAPARSAYLPISSLVVGNTYHVTLTGDASGNIAIYMNGAPTTATVTNETASSSTWTSAPLTLGGYTWDGFSKSRISALRIYNRVLSGSEISQNFDADKGRSFRTPVPALAPPPPVIQFDAGLTDSHRGHGTTWKDRATTGLVGTLSGGAYFTAFAGGTVLLDGTDDWVSVPQTFSLPGDYSITTWFKPAAITASSMDLVALHAPDGVNFGTLLELNNGVIRFLHWSPLIASGGPSNLSTATVDARRFHEVTLVRTGSKLALYVDGVLSDEVTTSTANYTSPMQLTIGRISSIYAQRHFQGHIANVAIHDRALSAAEVAANYAAIRPRFDLVLDYDLGSPNFLVNSRYFDLSNHAHHGTATGITYDATTQAQSFDSNDAVSAGNPSYLADLGNQLTVECWFMTNYNSSSTNDRPFLVSKRYSSGAGEASFELFLDNQVSGRRLYFGVKTASMSGGSYVISPVGFPLTDGKWHHALGTYDGTGVKLYVDGAHVGTSPITGPVFRKDYELLIGAGLLAGTRNPFYQWIGYISRVRIYKQALTADEIATHYSEFRVRHPAVP